MPPDKHYGTRYALVFIPIILLSVALILVKEELNQAKKENRALIEVSRVQFSAQPEQTQGIIPENTNPNNDKEALLELEYLLAQLQAENAELRNRLAEARSRKTEVQNKLEEVFKPANKDNLSSRVRTTLAKDEILITGGYKDAQGNYQFTFLQPNEAETDSKYRQIEIQVISVGITEETMQAKGLHTLKTSAGNTLQHGEAWKRDEFEKVFQKMDAEDILFKPSLTILPGREATLLNQQVDNGDYYEMKIIPNFSTESDGFDIDMSVEQSR